jgi:hypothetical protein
MQLRQAAATRHRESEAGQARSGPAPRFHWDCLQRKHDLSSRRFCDTPLQKLLLGMQEALSLLFSERLDPDGASCATGPGPAGR